VSIDPAEGGSKDKSVASTRFESAPEEFESAGSKMGPRGWLRAEIVLQEQLI
jgi:hypothetical protein